MATLSSTTAQLLDELARTGQLTAQAHVQINSAVRYYRDKGYWFMEGQETLTCSAGQEYYTLSADFANIYNAVVDIKSYDSSDSSSVTSTNTYPLHSRTQQHMDELYVSPDNYTGYPQDYSIYNGQIRLGPVPSGEYVIRMNVEKRAEVLSATSATNVMLAHAEELIIARAAKHMCMKILQDDKRAMIFAQIEQEERQNIQSETTRRLTTGHTKPRRGRYSGS